MSVNVVGMMWNKNEGDILEEIISEAIKHVDLLYVADDGSTDNSWEIIQRAASLDSKIIIQRDPCIRDPGQRSSLLNKIKERHNPLDTWVQVIESDIMILDTDVREAIRDRAVGDIAVTWQALNAVRPVGTWEEVDLYPNWGMPVKDLMPLAHRMERMVYTFRPMPDLYYTHTWRPWPSGFSRYFKGVVDPDHRDTKTPLLAHYGFRGPTHFKLKYAKMGDKHRRYPSWDLRTKETILATVPMFNGDWNGKAYPMSREGWINRKKNNYAE